MQAASGWWIDDTKVEAAPDQPVGASIRFSPASIEFPTHGLKDHWLRPDVWRLHLACPCDSRYLPGPTGTRPKGNSVPGITGQETQLLASDRMPSGRPAASPTPAQDKVAHAPTNQARTQVTDGRYGSAAVGLRST